MGLIAGWEEMDPGNITGPPTFANRCCTSVGIVTGIGKGAFRGDGENTD